MTETSEQKIARLEQELSKMTEHAEFHAYSVRQVAAQRSRHFKAFAILGEIANFDNGTKLTGVAETIQKSDSQFLQDAFALLLNRGKRDGFFVEFGACDGLLISNTVFLERDFGWKGILSEPSRSWHHALKANRKCILDFRCVHSESGKVVQFAEFSDDEYGTQSSVVDDSKSGATKDVYDVTTISLYDLLQEHNAPELIDFISIDVEGGEYEILKNFPFDKYRFGLACVEQMTEKQAGPIRSLFERAGYKQVLQDVSGHDGYYVLEDSDAFQILKKIAPPPLTTGDQKAAFWEQWYNNTEFTTDWSSRAFIDWDSALSSTKETTKNILEIGAWEGRGSIFFLNYFNNARVTCVDIFTLGNEERFDKNVMAKYGHRVKKIAGRSTTALDALQENEKLQYDLIYLDGSHDTDDVMSDSLLAWPLLAVGGALIWDDYKLLEAMPGSFARHQDPKPAIDTFLEWKSGQYEILHNGYQIIVRKTI